MSKLDPVQWEIRRERPFDRDGTTINRLRNIGVGLRFLGQQLGWSGDYFFPLTPRNFERRLLLDSTYGNFNFQRFRHPYIADLNLRFSGEEGLTNWVDFEQTNVVDFEENEFLFTGAATLYHQSGFPFKDRPYAVQGSHIYIDEPFIVEGADWDPEIEYIESRRAWRAKVNGPGTFTIRRLAGPSESTEVTVRDWTPFDLFPAPERIDNYYGPWNSKGTFLTLEWLLNLLGLGGFTEEESLKLPPFVVRYDIIDNDFVFDDFYVDDERLSGRTYKGLESLTNIGSRITRIKLDTAGLLTYEFSKVEVQTINITTNETVRVDITELFYTQRPPEIAMASVTNLFESPRIYYVEPLTADNFDADEPRGIGSDEIYILLPFNYARGGEHWNKATKLAYLFTYFGKRDDEVVLQKYDGEDVVFYEEVYDNWRNKRFFHEDFLISLLKEDRFPEESEWIPPQIEVEETIDKEPGWLSGRVQNYDPQPLRKTTVLGWEGSFYERVTEESLSGFIERDMKEGKLIVARNNTNPLFTPQLSELYLEETNIVKVAYCYFVADFSAAEEPVF
jgi:hypothetical protein